MKTGMLWFDNDPKTSLATKIERAVEYYRRKYGRDPNLCLVHPSMAPLSPDGDTPPNSESTNLGGVVVRAYKPVLPGHLWVGIEQAGG